jgi:hypothetical protein
VGPSKPALAVCVVLCCTAAWGQSADRKISEWTLSMGGRVRLAGAKNYVNDLALLPCELTVPCSGETSTTDGMVLSIHSGVRTTGTERTILTLAIELPTFLIHKTETLIHRFTQICTD